MDMTDAELASIRHQNSETIKNRDHRSSLGYDDGFMQQLRDHATAAEQSNRLIDEIERLRDELDAALTMLTEVTDVAIASVEGVAHKLRMITGYVERPYPPLERVKT